MKKLTILIILLCCILSGCFSDPDITPPIFIPKSAPDSLVEHGIDAHYGDAIYLEWYEPENASAEGIQSYYIYRGKKNDKGLLEFDYIDEVKRSDGVIYKSDRYIDYSVNFDTTYYYYLKSSNNFTTSSSTSDTCFYKLVNRAHLSGPSGDIQVNNPRFSFQFPIVTVNNINYFYLRLYYLDEGSYKIKYFVKIFRFDLAKNQYYVYLNNNDQNATILYEDLLVDEDSNKYLEQGTYRWRVDAVAAELAGSLETEGSESDWVYFTVK